MRSQNSLGWMYENGQGVEKDLEEAVKWYRKAADQGNAYAQYNVGVVYYKGEGVLRFQGSSKVVTQSC